MNQLLMHMSLSDQWRAEREYSKHTMKATERDVARSISVVNLNSTEENSSSIDGLKLRKHLHLITFNGRT